MKKYIKNFYEFINESIKTKGEIKSDELWDLSGENPKKYEKLMRKYLEDNLDVENFLKYFSENMLNALTDALEKANKDTEYYNEQDEDGIWSEGFKLNDLDEFVFDMDDDETYGEFGISLNYFNNKFDVFAFNGELDLTDSYQIIIEIDKNSK